MGNVKTSWDGEVSTRNCLHAKVVGDKAICDIVNDYIKYSTGQIAHRIERSANKYSTCRNCPYFEAMG